jgi:DAACS family dicarboxylate/amino acid:cation (Na+ or H+) symporter
MSRHSKIFIGLITGAAAGVASNFLFPDAEILKIVQTYVSDPLGKIFLNLLIMMVIPLVFASLALGVAQIGDLKKLGRIGFKTISYFFLVTAIAVTLGLILVNTIRPGDYLQGETKTQLLSSYSEQASQIKEISEKTEFGIQTLVNIVPRNPLAAVAKPNPEMLALIFFRL